MIHITELTDQVGFEFYFTKGISYSDIEEMFRMFKKYSWSGEDTDMTKYKNTEYFPSTKKYSNVYRQVFMDKREKNRILQLVEDNKKKKK